MLALRLPRTLRNGSGNSPERRSNEVVLCTRGDPAPPGRPRRCSPGGRAPESGRRTGEPGGPRARVGRRSREVIDTEVWRVEFDREAAKELRKLGRPAGQIILRHLRQRIATADDPRRFGKTLAGEPAGVWRYRLGAYRLMVTFEDKRLVVLVLRIDRPSARRVRLSHRPPPLSTLDSTHFVLPSERTSSTAQRPFSRTRS